MSPVAVVPSEGNNTLSRVSSREEQCDSRLRVTLATIISRVDAQQRGVYLVNEAEAYAGGVRGGSLEPPF